jgi:hypothetical protein
VDDRLLDLVDAYVENRLTDADAAELRELLRQSDQARQVFWECIAQHALIDDILSEGRGRDLALAEAGEAIMGMSPARVKGHGPWRRRLAAVTALAACLLVVVALSLRGPAAAPLATVPALAGDVQRIDASGKAMALQAEAALAAGERLQVGEDESWAEVLFADGTQVALGAGTEIQLPIGTARQLHVGKGAVLVQTAAQPASPLIVTTDHARIIARSARFRLYREPTASRLELEAGKVQFESPPGAGAVEVAEGSYVIAGDRTEPMVPLPLPAGECRLKHTLVRAGDALCFSRDGSVLVTTHFARGWKAWNTRDGALQASAPGLGQWASGLAFTPREDTVLALGNGGAAMFWKIGDPQPGKAGLRETKLRCGAVSPDGRWLAQGMTGEVSVWSTDADHGRISLAQTIAIKPSRIALSTTGPQLAVSRWGGAIQVFDVTTGRETSQHRLSRTATPLALSADSRFLAAYASGDGLVLFDRQAGERRTLWPAEVARVECLDFSTDGRVVVAGLADGTVRAWRARDGESLLVLDTGHRHVNRATLSADGSLLAAIGDSDCVKTWECRLP